MERGLTIERVIDTGTPISVMIRTTGALGVKQSLDILITRLLHSFNLNLTINEKSIQIPMIVNDLIERYPNETIEDFAYIFKQARQGAYGQVFRIDSAVIFGWVTQHIEDKYKVKEARLMAEKDRPYEILDTHKDGKKIEPIPISEASTYLKQLLSNIESVETKAIPPLTSEQVRQEGKEKPENRIAYKPYFREEDLQRHRSFLRKTYSLNENEIDQVIEQWRKQ